MFHLSFINLSCKLLSSSIQRFVGETAATWVGTNTVEKVALTRVLVAVEVRAFSVATVTLSRQIFRAQFQQIVFHNGQTVAEPTFVALE